MRKWIMVLVVVAFMGFTFGPVSAGDSPGPAGPAPNSGDGIPDGSGFDPSPPSPGPAGPQGK